MALEHYFSREWKHVDHYGETETETENSKGCFDCNICFDSARDPVVTLCGHLYCWPCIYKWLHVQTASLASEEQPQCPVCKVDISHTTMIPLYGRGQSEVESKTIQQGIALPPRPPAYGSQIPSTRSTSQQLPYRNPYQHANHDPLRYRNREEDSSPPLVNMAGTSYNGFHHPMAGMFGEMVYERVFGNGNSLNSYPYHLARRSGNRLRRREMQVDKSLNRLSIFFLCCVILCIIVF